MPVLGLFQQTFQDNVRLPALSRDLSNVTSEGQLDLDSLPRVQVVVASQIKRGYTERDQLRPLRIRKPH